MRGSAATHWLSALQAHGLQGGANIVSLCDASQSFYCATIPEYHAPKYRDMQLIMQRLARFPNFCGVTIGADNAGYVPYWDWAPPHPEKSWSEGLAALMGDAQTAGAGRPGPRPPQGLRGQGRRSARLPRLHRPLRHHLQRSAAISPRRRMRCAMCRSPAARSDRRPGCWARAAGRPAPSRACSCSPVSTPCRAMTGTS
jgi:hypothetical protein